MLALLDDDAGSALEGLGRGVAILDTLSQQGPAPYRAIWPLLLAAHGDAAAAAIGNARRIGLTVNRVNRGLLGYADAILAGRAGDQRQATELAAAADGELGTTRSGRTWPGSTPRSPRWQTAGASRASG